MPAPPARHNAAFTAEPASWQDDSVPMTTRLRSARVDADAGEAAAMAWQLQEFRRQEPAQLTTQSLSRLRRFITLPSLGTTGLTSPYATVGDQPNIVAIIEEILSVDEYAGMRLAIAADAQPLSDLIIGNILAQERGEMPITDLYPDATRNFQDIFCRVIATDAAIATLIATLPTTSMDFQQRMLENLL